MSKSSWQDMRGFIEFLEEQGDIIHIKEEVEPEWEVNGITNIALQEQGTAIIFEKIKGADLPLVTGFLGSDKR